MSKGSAPPAPNYAQAAQAQGSANTAAGVQSTRLSNPNINTPLGSQTVSYGDRTFDQAGYDAENAQRARVGLEGVDPSTFWNVGSPTITQSLSPQGQQLFDVNQQTQLGLGGLANQGISQVQGALGQPFNPQGPLQVSSLSQGNFQGGPAPTTIGAPNVSQYTQDVTRAPDQTTSASGYISPTTTNTALNPSGGGQIQYGLGGAGDVSRGFADVGNNQRALNFGGAPALPQASFSGQNDPVTQAIIAREQPFMDTRRSQLDTQLRNQGLVPGGEAYDNATRDLDRQQNDFNLAAIQAGAQQQNQMFGQQLAAHQQGVGEIGQQGQFANTAQGQAFQQAAMRGDFGNAAQQQAFSQQLAGGQFGNQAQQQGYQQAFGNAGLNLGAQQQAFGQQVGADQQALARQQQAYGQGLAGAGLNLGAEQQAYGQSLGLGQYGLGAQQQQYGQEAQTAQMGNQAEQASLAQQQTAGAFQNQARAQALQEQAYKRSLPLNEVAALMSGSQVQMPQFQGFSGSQVQPAPLFGATQAQGQYGMNAYNQQVAQRNAMMGGLFQLGSSALPLLAA